MIALSGQVNSKGERKFTQVGLTYEAEAARAIPTPYSMQADFEQTLHLACRSFARAPSLV
jgi:hypothetical protein